MTPERHKEVIDQQKEIVKRRSEVSSEVLKRLPLDTMLRNRKKAKNLFVALMVKNSVPMFKENSELGRKFAEEKLQ